jgi:DNA-binding beta-propeller fold protein YncE
MSGASGIAFDSPGNPYVANFYNNTIEKYSSTGADLGVFANMGLNEPIGLAFDSSGNLYVTNYGDNTIVEFANSIGGLSSTGTVFASTGLNEPYGIAIEPGALVAVPEPSNLILFGLFLALAFCGWLFNRRQNLASVTAQ